MKKKSPVITIVMITILFFFISCTTDTHEHKENTTCIQTEAPQLAPIPISQMAYTHPSILNQLYCNDSENVIHYNIARLLAETELIAGANFILEPTIPANANWYLTRYPKVILNYDNTPKYYEFGYVYQNQIVATITTYAKKEIAGVIAYVFNNPLEYNCTNLDYYVGNYPNRYYGSNGICNKKNCNEELDTDLPEQGSTEEAELELMFQQMTEDDISGIQEDMNNQGEDLSEDINERDEYWQQIDDFTETYLSELLTGEEDTTDIEHFNLQDFLDDNIENGTNSEIDYVDQLIELLDYEVGYFDTFILPEYSDSRLQVTHWSGFCGPAACAWVYRGKYNSYQNYYLPIFGDGTYYNDYFREDHSAYNAEYLYSVNTSGSLSEALNAYNEISEEADNGLAACFYNETVPFWHGGWQFPLYHGGLNRGFKNATNDEYYVTLTCSPYNWIARNEEPLIIAINCNHYIVAFGSGVTKKKNGNIKDKYFLVTDNGSTTGPSHHPYMRKKNFWNLHYGLTH